MSEIITKINDTVKKYNMLSKGDTVVVGVSGGADSMLLLNYLYLAADIYGIKIIAANVEHGIRGEESLDDTAFVRDYCTDRKIEFHCLSIDAPTGARECGLGVEEYSRQKRYEFFSSFGGDKIATAHSLTDSVETVLFRLSRGTSINGTGGIPAVRDNIIRPLIECTSDEIRDYCHSHSIPYRVDSTNSDTKYSRNYIRSIVLPDYEKLNPSFQQTLMRFAQSSSEDNDFIDREAEKIFIAAKYDDRLNLRILRPCHIAIKKRVIKKYIESLGHGVDTFHLEKFVTLIDSPGRYQLTGDMFVLADKNTLRVAKNENITSVLPKIVNKTIIDNKEFLTNCELLRKEFDFYLDYDKIVGDISVRFRKAGDTIKPAGRNCTKSLKKLFCEHKIDVEKRESIPIVTDGFGVVAVDGVCIDERVMVNDSTKRVLLFNIRMEDYR